MKYLFALTTILGVTSWFAYNNFYKKEEIIENTSEGEEGEEDEEDEENDDGIEFEYEK